jgi:hypothetical protein
LNKHEKWLFVVPVALLLVPVILRVTKQFDLMAYLDPRGDALDRAIRRKVGYAQDCGTVPVGGNPAAADACSVSAFKAKRAFRVRYEDMGSDSQRSVAIAGTTHGDIYFFDYDSDPSGGSNIGEAVYEHQCKAPLVIQKPGRRKILCGDR